MDQKYIAIFSSYSVLQGLFRFQSINYIMFPNQLLRKEFLTLEWKV
jgi:hypothetical protein